jgi:hypothetical protein
MPEFTPEDVDINVWEFVDACDEEEIEELLEYLKEKGYLDNKENRSMNESMFMDALNKIKNNWLSLSREEEDVILNIAKRF